jgi:hypothetical protein
VPSQRSLSRQESDLKLMASSDSRTASGPRYAIIYDASCGSLGVEGIGQIPSEALDPRPRGKTGCPTGYAKSDLRRGMRKGQVLAYLRRNPQLDQGRVPEFPCASPRCLYLAERAPCSALPA